MSADTDRQYDVQLLHLQEVFSVMRSQAASTIGPEPVYGVTASKTPFIFVSSYSTAGSAGAVNESRVKMYCSELEVLTYNILPVLRDKRRW